MTDRTPPAQRTTNAGPWKEWMDALPAESREDVVALAAALLPGMMTPAHTRESGDMDDAAISSALRIAERFYRRVRG